MQLLGLSALEVNEFSFQMKSVWSGFHLQLKKTQGTGALPPKRGQSSLSVSTAACGRALEGRRRKHMKKCQSAEGTWSDKEDITTKHNTW